MRTAFVFPGQGSQWPGMAGALLAAGGAFADTFRACAQAVRDEGGPDLVAAVARVDAPLAAGGLDEVRVVQPALWAVMVSLAAAWREHGIEPDVIVGHSQGEVAAACAAGALDLVDGARVVVRRADLLAELAGSGGMLCLGADAATATALISAWPGRLHLAVLNGPETVLVSGDDDALDELAAHCRSVRLKHRRVAVDYAGHSPLLERLHDRLVTALRDLAPRPLRTPMISTVTGAAVRGPELDADYWYRNLRHPVLFAPVATGLERAVDCVVECSPHPVLVPAVRAASAHPVLASLRRGCGGPDTLAASVAQWHALAAGSVAA